MPQQGTDQNEYQRRVGAGAGKGGDPKKWIAGAIENPGALRKKAGTKKGQNIPTGKINEMAKAPGKTGKQARLAKTLKSFKK